MHDYTFISPSLEGILTHSSVTYEGVTRPMEIFRVLDGPGKRKAKTISEAEHKILEQYFHDLHEVFTKKLTAFALETNYIPSASLKLQAMLQEMIKVKRLLGSEIEV